MWRHDALTAQTAGSGGGGGARCSGSGAAVAAANRRTHLRLHLWVPAWPPARRHGSSPSLRQRARCSAEVDCSSASACWLGWRGKRRRAAHGARRHSAAACAAAWPPTARCFVLCLCSFFASLPAAGWALLAQVCARPQPCLELLTPGGESQHEEDEGGQHSGVDQHHAVSHQDDVGPELHNKQGASRGGVWQWKGRGEARRGRTPPGS